MIFIVLFGLARGSEICLIGCRESAFDSPIVSSELVTLLSASTGGFSVDFNEECSIQAPYHVRETDPASVYFHEFVVAHESETPLARSYHGVCGPNFTTTFEYLNSSDSGAVLNSEYSYKCLSTDFYPDRSYFPLPDLRNQTCMYGVQLSQGVSNQFGAAFWSRKQQVIYGFDTTFKFRVIHRSEYCGVQESPNAPKWCYERGGRGFAFVIQNEGSPGINGVGDEISYKISALGRVSLGYMFPRNLAIEFDYMFHTDSNDPSWNHIAVMVPVSKQPSEGDNSNVADHSTNTLAIATGVELPALHEGLHTVRVTYDVHNPDKWQHMTSDWYSRPLLDDQRLMAQFWSHGKPGMLEVYLDSQVVIKTLVDLSLVVQADSVDTASPGSAWVGFVASTGADNFAGPLIVDWRWTTESQCPVDDPDQPGTTTCRRGEVVGDSQSVATKFSLRNIGTVDIQLIASLEDNEPIICTNGLLSWNQVHPYFLGCERSVVLGATLTSLLITDSLGVRSLRLTDQTLINRDYSGKVFLRRQLSHYCVIEHESDPYRFYFAQCDCSFCARIFDNQQLYSVFYSQRCYDRYTFACSCFEVSQMATNTFAFDYLNRANPWRFISQPGYSFQTKNLQFQRHTVCRGCKFDNHCSRFNRLGVCDTPTTIYRVGNPLSPVIGGSFQSWSRGVGAEDGAIKGNACNCGDRIVEPSYTTYSGEAQLFPVFQVAYLQGTPTDCRNCLRLPGSNCASVCGSPQLVSYAHLPSGQSCATCMLASSSLYDLTPARLTRLRTCAYSTIQAGNDPWTECVDTVNSWLSGTQEEAQSALTTFLNGVATHFLVECPSRPLETDGAVCVPNLFANSVIPMQVLARGPAEASSDGIYFPVWWDGVACLNAACRLQAREDCYIKRYKFVFSQDPVTGTVSCSDMLGSGIGCYLAHSTPEAVGFNSTSESAVFKKEYRQYGYTDPLDRSTWSTDPSITGMRRKTLEVWASVDPSDAIEDLNSGGGSGSVISASSSWGDDYVPGLAMDNSLSTFWQSVTSISPSFSANWTLDFGSVTQNARGYSIYWTYLATNFTVLVSTNGGSKWTVVDTVVNNRANTTVSGSFIKFNQLRIFMTAANRTRPAGQDQGMYAYGIAEIVIRKDNIVSRLKPIEVSQERQFVGHRAVDGDLNTWWSTPPGVGHGESILAYTNNVPLSDIALVRAVFRRGLAPGSVAIEVSDASGDWVSLTCDSIGCDSDPISGFDYIVSLSQAQTPALSQFDPTRTQFRLSVAAGALYYGYHIVQLAEFEVYSSLTGFSGEPFQPTVCVLGNRQACASTGTTLGAGSVGYFSNWVSSYSLGNNEYLGIFEINFSDSNSVPASVTVSSPSTVTLIPSFSSLGQSNVFAVIVNTISDLTVRIASKAGSATRITKMELRPMNKLNLSLVSVDSEWVESFPTTFPQQGHVANVIDGDYRTDWRPRLGAPAMTGTASVDLDYILKFKFSKTAPIDMIYIEYSYASDWFRVDTASGGFTCEWTSFYRLSGSVSTGTDCSGGQISVIEKGNYYRFASGMVAIGSSFWQEMSLTIMQVSARDRLAGQPILGIKEVEIYTANPAIQPSSVSIDGLPTAGAIYLFDSNFTTEYATPDFGNPSGTSIWIDLGTKQRIKEVQLWWSLNSAVAAQSKPIHVTIGVVYDDVFSCDDLNAAAYLQDSQLMYPSPTAQQLVYSGTTRVDPVRCIQLILFSPSAMVVGEIRITKAEPSFGASIVASSLINPELAIDSDSTTAATAVAVNSEAVFIMFDLASDFDLATPVWGVSIGLSNFAPNFLLDPESGITLYYCPSGAVDKTLATCIANGVSVTVIQEMQEMFLFGPGLTCNGCGRIAVTFQPSSDSLSVTTGNLFSVNEISIYGSAKIPPLSVSFDDDRVWSNLIEAANDGLNSTFWVSERDVSSSNITLSLLADGEDPSNPPYYISSLAQLLYMPSRNTLLYSSLDGSNWLRATDGEAFFAKFIKMEVSDPSVNTTALTPTLWASPVFAVSELYAISPSSIQRGRQMTSSRAVSDDDYSGIGTLWLSVPPSANATYHLGARTDIAGVVLDWLFPASSYSLSLLSGSVALTAPLATLSDSSVRAPSSRVSTVSAVPLGDVDSVQLSLTRFSSRYGLEMAALNSISVFAVGDAVLLSIPSAPALDDSPAYLVDGDLATAYTSPSNIVGSVTISIQLSPSLAIGKLLIVWRTICSSFSVLATRVGAIRNSTVFSTTTNADSISSLSLALNVTNIYVVMNQNANGQSFSYSIYEIQAWSAALVVPADINIDPPTNLQPSAANDLSNNTVWMAPPTDISASNPVSLTLDLGSVFPVKQASILWGWAPFADEWLEDLIATRRDFQISLDGFSFSSVVHQFHYNSTTRTDLCAEPLRFRFLRLVLMAPFEDPNLDPTTTLFGPSVKDIEVFVDDNLARDNEDKAVTPDINGWWNFPPKLTSDGSNSTMWLSRRGQSTASLFTDFGSVKNLAGVHLLFEYIAGSVSFYNSTDCVSYALLATVTGNTKSLVSLSGQTYQFIAKCVKVTLENALTQIPNPDNGSGPRQNIFGVKLFSVLENKGGGGLFGIEAQVGGVWGSVFDTITYAPFQPTQWNLMSNQQLRSSAVNGPTGFDEISEIVHIVATFSDTNITLFRNGVQFGSSYSAPTIAWDMVEDVRLVFGVRSSAFANDSIQSYDDLMGYGGANRISYLNPFYSGQIESATLISRALLPEEVVGLYEAGKLGLRERGCLCYDSCPVGRNKYYPEVDVPCSGQGVCRREYDALTGLPSGGVCECTGGFFGDNCENHCSSFGGCCSVDDDCPTDMTCDTARYTCTTGSR